MSSAQVTSPLPSSMYVVPGRMKRSGSSAAGNGSDACTESPSSLISSTSAGNGHTSPKRRYTRDSIF